MLDFVGVTALIVLAQSSSSLATFVIHFSEMPASMNRLLNATAVRATDKFVEPNDIAKEIASEFEAEEGGCWNCIVVKGESQDDLGWSLVHKKRRYTTISVGDWYIGLIQHNC